MCKFTTEKIECSEKLTFFIILGDIPFQIFHATYKIAFSERIILLNGLNRVTDLKNGNIFKTSCKH